MRAGQNHYRLLDALRGVAALAVVCGHLGDAWGHPVGQDYVLAVDFFFILSGFVIAHAYRDKLASTMSAIEFWRVRAVRLYPLLVVGAIAGGISLLVTHAAQSGWSAGNILVTMILAAFALPSFLLPGAQAFPANGPAWSLLFELIANFLYAPLALFLTRKRLVALTLVAAGLLAFETIQRGTIESGWSKDHLVGGLFRVFFGFTCGLALYEFRPQWRIAARWGWLLMLALAALLFSPITHYAHGQLVIAMMFMPAIVWVGSAIETAGVGSRISAFLGALSYPLYILHKPVMEVTTAFFRSAAPDVDWKLIALFQVAIFVAVAWLGLRLFDEPVRARLGRWFKARRSRKMRDPDPHAPST
ncbi:MAG: acyltransferase [Hyphomonadaceae bacterium]